MTDQLTPYRPAPVTLRGGADPQTLAQVIKLVQHAAKEGEGEAMMRLAVAEQAGLSLGEALNGIYMVKGRPTLSATTQLALMRRAGIRTRWIESTDEVAHLRMWIPGDPEPVDEIYTIEDARRAGLLGSATWRAHPRPMLRHRCTTAASRAHCPEVLGGAIYDRDEIEAIDHAGPPLAQEQPAPAKPARPWQDLAASVLSAERTSLLGDPSGWDRDSLRDEVQALRREDWRAACASMIADLSSHGWDAAMIDGELAEQGWTQASYDRAIAALADLRDPGAAKQPEPPAPAEPDESDPFA